MDLHCIKCLKFTSESYIKIRYEIYGKINLCSYRIDCSFQTLKTTDKKEISDLLKN